ncbi:MAG: EAL domain-containing protein [Candidatus Peregrinibacteria bacterium]|nr:EAL domain-containing protein [Candidatus Peregrinibacteria bacterium]
MANGNAALRDELIAVILNSSYSQYAQCQLPLSEAGPAIEGEGLFAGVQMLRLTADGDLQNKLPDPSTVEGVEVLFRLLTARGVFKPMEVIPAAQEGGLMPHVGRFVMRRTGEIGANMHAIDGKRRLVCCNIDDDFLSDPSFEPSVEQAVHTARGNTIGLELLEKMKTLQGKNIEKLRRLVKLEVVLLVDDFGQENSGKVLEAVLEAGLPVHSVKVDSRDVKGIHLRRPVEEVLALVDTAKRKDISSLIFEGGPGIGSPELTALNTALEEVDCDLETWFEGCTYPYSRVA